mgnify:CR=1 FL=1
MKKMFTDKLSHKYGFGANKNVLLVDWEKSIGQKVKGIYDDINFEVEIVNYYKKNNRGYLDIKYNNDVYSICASSFILCKLGNILGKKTNVYKYNVGNIIKTNTGKLKILKQIRIKYNNEKTEKGYKYKCLNCNNIGTILEAQLKNKTGCNVCCSSPKKALKNYNDMWTTNPELASLLANPEDGYKYTENSHQKLDWKCPNCGDIIKNKEIASINRNGLSCPKCGDGISYPEKFMYNVLEQLNINFIYQLTKTTFNWCDKYKYDFYMSEYNIIIETNGKGHYEEGFGRCGGRTLKEEQENDKFKKELALQNGIKPENYVVIDCRESTLEWIKKYILSSKLNELFDLSKIDWLKCHKFACSSLVKKACDLWNSGICSTTKIGKTLNLCQAVIIKYLKQGAKLGWCDYDVKKIIVENARINGNANKKAIVCLNNKKIFSSIKETQNYYNINLNISSCCQNKQKYAGKDLQTGEYLQWQYYEDYLIKPKKLLSNDEIDKLRHRGKRCMIICLNNNKIFDSITNAGKYYNIKYFEKRANKCLKDRQKSCGKDPITGEKLRWMYYEDYLKLNNEKENKVVNE